MGGKISREEMKDLRKQTRGRLNNGEIEKYHKFWFELYPDGQMTKDGFEKFAKLALPTVRNHTVDHQRFYGQPDCKIIMW